MREIVLDTETTGFEPSEGHRLVEIACLELVNQIPTGNHKRFYLNPERDMPEAAYRIHGLSIEFLSDKPKFAEVADELLGFIGDAPLVIHNAEFDMKFINAELARISRSPLPMDRAVDTVRMARQRCPGAPASLDALCKRFAIDNTQRTLHGALLDAQLLAEVYLQLLGGPQTGLGLDKEAERQSAERSALALASRIIRPARPHAASPEELAAHAAFVAKLKDPVWLN
ncbi:MAG TPA: DNA polymerase III subunit epsilon [Dongiaceae bacterium]|nr:DNA polymerase III subunit epsilon [Dongiaceae bacterium]